jgi:peptidoglycan hydrolase-like protein with peptidoglycan-binding domain
MRLTTVAVCTLATLTATELTHETGQNTQPQSPNQPLPAIDAVSQKNTAPVSQLTQPVSLPERGIHLPDRIGAAPAFAGEPQPKPKLTKSASPEKPAAQNGPIANSTAPAAAPTRLSPIARGALCDISPINLDELTSSQVLLIQQYLRAKGFYSDSVDGIWGERTEESVAAYQKARGLKVDGIVGAQTWNALATEIQAMVAKSPEKLQTAPAPPIEKTKKPTVATPQSPPAKDRTQAAVGNDRPQTRAPQPAPDEQQVRSSPAQVSSESSSSYMRFVAGLAMALSAPIIGVTLWYLLRPILVKGREEPSAPRPHKKVSLEQDSLLSIQDELALQKHCQGLADILTRHNLEETTRFVSRDQKKLVVRILEL